MNPKFQNEWRLAFAKKLFQALKPMDGLAAAFVGGSVARELADEYSDLELCFVWHSDPSDEDRKKIIQAFGGELFADWQPWTNESGAVEDNIFVNGFQIDIWHNTVAKDLADIDAVLLRSDTNQNKLNFLDVIRNCVPLSDPDDLVGDWKRRVEEYPRALKKKIIEENIAFFSSGNANIHLHRGDLTILYGLISGLQKRIFNVLLALNERYFPTYKRMHIVLRGMAIKPKGIEETIDLSYAKQPPEAWRITEDLMRETLILVESHCPEVDTKKAHRQLSTKRKKQPEMPTEK